MHTNHYYFENTANYKINLRRQSPPQPKAQSDGLKTGEEGYSGEGSKKPKAEPEVMV